MTVVDPRTRIDVLSREVCLQYLAMHHLGRLAVVVDGQPLVFPVNYALDGASIVFRTDGGTKLHAALGGPVAFEVDEADNVWHAGWSVVVSGHAHTVPSDEHARLRRLPLGPWCPGPKETWVRIVADAITGRRINAREVTLDSTKGGT
jgi:uncharacterized protein